MQDFIEKKIVLGICGGIAAYKSAYLVRELIQLGAEVRVVMTDSAKKFITPITLQALSGNEVRMELFDEQAERAMGHIELARWADYFLIAPASANCLAKLAHGLADDLLSTLYLVSEAPLIICPAMNASMWHHPATIANCAILKERGALIVGPDEGSQACGEFGLGRLSQLDFIINALRLVTIQNRLLGQKVLITAGPTQEILDPVRYITNKSSGRMGYALAQAAAIAGAEVTLISGPTELEVPPGVKCHKVITAQEMYDKTMDSLETGIVFIGCAAVADYTPQTVATNKIKKQEDTLSLSLNKTKDILTAVVKSRKASFVMGFAAETENLLANANLKLNEKKLDMIVANQVGEGMGFNMEMNQVVVVTKNNQKEINLCNKVRLAGQLIAILASSIHNDAPKAIGKI
jgi:phosphopantothenoylcysteine decarboxylase/phosphopantothenate--cysteine ligase